MKFTINSGVLADAISAGISSVPSKPINPIVAGVRIEATPDAVSFASFNYERSTSRTVMADVAAPDVEVVSGRLLAVIGGNLPKNAESVVTSSGNEMVIATGRTEYRLPLMHRMDYPELPVLDENSRIGSVNSESFCEAVRVIGDYAGSDPVLPELSALHITADPNSMMLVSTDRYIVARRHLDWAGTQDVEINVPASDMLATVKAAAGTGADDIEILWDGALLGLRTPATTITTRVLAEKFPNMAQFLTGDSYYTAATLDTAELAAMLKRAAQIADDKNHQVDIEIEDGQLLVTTTQSSAGKVTDSTSVTHHGPGRRLALSSQRLLATLNVIDTNQVTLAFKEKGYLVSVIPGPIEPDLRPPDVDSVAVLVGIVGVRS